LLQSEEPFEFPEEIEEAWIDLSKIQLNKKLNALISDAISKSHHLTNVTLLATEHYILDSNAVDLIKQIHNVPCLYICGEMVPDGTKNLGEALKMSTGFKSLQFFRTDFSANELAYICDGLINNSSITEVDLHASYFGNDGCNMMADLLKVNKTISKLDISQSFISDCSNLFEALKTNTTLKELNLFGNTFDTAQLGTLLKHNHSLEYLNLGLAGIKRGLDAISEALIGHRSLRNMCLLYNHFDYQGLHKLVECMRENYSVVSLQVTDSNATDNYNVKLIQELEEITARNEALQNENYFNTVIFIRGLIRNKRVLDVLPVEIWSAIFSEIEYPGVAFSFSAFFGELYRKTLHKMDES
jgi:hypothetical protein